MKIENRKFILISINLLIGSLILILAFSSKNNTSLENLWIVLSFSIVAVACIFFILKRIGTHPPLYRVIVFSGVLGILVPLIGSSLFWIGGFLFAGNSHGVGDSMARGVLIGVMSGAIAGIPAGLPLFLLNIPLIRWVTNP
jgi:hypothetical protein